MFFHLPSLNFRYWQYLNAPFQAIPNKYWRLVLWWGENLYSSRSLDNDKDHIRIFEPCFNMHITQQITQQEEIQTEDLWKYKMTQTLTKRLCVLCITGILSWQPLKSGKAILPLVPEYLTVHTEYKASLQELTSILLTTTDLSHNPLLSQAAHTLSALLTRCFHTLCGSLHVGMIVKSSCLNCQSFIFSRLLRICLLPGDFTSPNAFDLFNSIIHLKCKFVL